MTDKRHTQDENTPEVKKRGHGLRNILWLLGGLLLFALLVFLICTPATMGSDMTEYLSSASGKYASEFEQDDEDSTSYWEKHLPNMPGPSVKLKINYFGDLSRVFNDSNHVHYAEAETYGIEPLTDTRSHWKLKRAIVKVSSCGDYFIDSLRHSQPYLVPEAVARLHEIGRRFRDSVDARGGGDYRVKVTSLLRTPQSVKRLRSQNRNSIDSSVHQFGTTFDISYASFIADSEKRAVSVDDLKGVLSEVLKAMREEGKIWVKYERKQPCFHITARKPRD